MSSMSLEHQIDSDDDNTGTPAVDDDELTYYSVDPEIKQIHAESQMGTFTPVDFELTLRRMLVSLGANYESDHLDNFRFYLGLTHLFGSDFTPAGIRSKLPYINKLYYSRLQLPEAFLGLEAYLSLQAPHALENSNAVVAFLATCWQEDFLNGKDIIEYFSAPLNIDNLKFKYDVRPLKNEIEVHDRIKKLVEPFLDRFVEDDSESESDSEEVDVLKSKLANLKANDGSNSESDVEIDFGAGGVTIDDGNYDDDSDSESESESS